MNELLIGLVAVISMIIGAFAYGRRTKSKEVQVEKLKEYKKTVEAINEVPFTTTRTDALDRLRKSGDLRD